MSYSNLKLFSLSSNHELAQKVAKEIGIELGKVSVGAHSDGETVVHIDESVRGDHVFIHHNQEFHQVIIDRVTC